MTLCEFFFTWRCLHMVQVFVYSFASRSGEARIDLARVASTYVNIIPIYVDVLSIAKRNPCSDCVCVCVCLCVWARVRVVAATVSVRTHSVNWFDYYHDGLFDIHPCMREHAHGCRRLADVTRTSHWCQRIQDWPIATRLRIIRTLVTLDRWSSNCMNYRHWIAVYIDERSGEKEATESSELKVLSASWRHDIMTSWRVQREKWMCDSRTGEAF
jgi:hypothetical protein